MHILTADSALMTIRAIRCGLVLSPLPVPVIDSVVAYVPGRPAPLGKEDVAAPHPDDVTLRQSGFDFAAVEANRSIGLTRFGSFGDVLREGTLDLGVFDPRKRDRNKSIRTRLLSRDLPMAALIRVTPALYIASPELIILQLAATHTSVQLAQLIMELCGTYSLSPQQGDEASASYQLDPVMSLESLRAIRSQVKMHGGKAIFEEALSMALEGSASPAETCVALMMSLPADQGGYGFPKPTLNALLTTPQWERDHVAGASYHLDAFWQGCYTDLECESIAYHLDPFVAQALQAARSDDIDVALLPDDRIMHNLRQRLISKADADRQRMRDIQSLGIQVVPVTSYDLSHLRRLDQVAWALAKRRETTEGIDATTHMDALDDYDARQRRLALLEQLSPMPFVELW